MRVTLADGSALDVRDDVLNQGAEGEIFMSRDGRHVIKHYWNPETWREQAVQNIMTKYNVVRDQDPVHEQYWQSLFCWPDAIVRSPWFGIRMPCAPREVRKLLDFLLPKFRRMRLTATELGTWSGHLAIAAKLARAIRRMHLSGLCHSDLSWNNMLVDPRTGRMCLIDCDGLVVPGFLPPTVLGTPEFMAPEVVAGAAKPSTRTDLHAMAVLIYRMLLFGHPLNGQAFYSADSEEDDRLRFGAKGLYREHPTDRRNAPRDRRGFYSARILGPALQRLAHRAFVEGLHEPMRRPGAAEWEQALVRTADRVVPCLNPSCEMKTFVFLESDGYNCPWCGGGARNAVARSRGVALPSSEVPLIRMYRPVPGRAGQFQDEGYVVVAWQGRTLHLWHGEPTKTPGPGVDSKPLAQFAFDRGRWVLTNNGFNELQSQADGGARTHLPTGQSVEVRNGMRFIFGPLDHCRLGLVQFVPIA
jgi:DNA-binding helix-hairpin-helix protein with protein kinase domain